MILALPFIAGAAILAVMTHLVSILLMPQLTRNDTYARFARIVQANTTAALDQSQIDALRIAYSDPAFAVAVCRYDLSAGILRVRAPVTGTLLTVTIAARGGGVFYSLTDRSAADEADGIDVVIGTPEQIAKIEAADPDDEAVSELRIRAAQNEGIVVFRVLALTESAQEIAARAVASCTCAIEGLEDALKAK